MASVPPCFEPNGSQAEDFGLETEATSANHGNQMKFQLSPAPAGLPHSRKKLFLLLSSSPEQKVILQLTLSRSPL